MSSAASTIYTSGWRAYLRGSPGADLQKMPNSSAIFLVRFRFGSKETELAVLPGKTARKRVFYDGSKHGIGHYEASLTAPLEPVGQDSEGIGVAFEMRNIIPKLR